MQRYAVAFVKLLLLITLNFKFYFTSADSISFFPYGTATLSDINDIFNKEVGSTKICRISFLQFTNLENQTK